VPVEISRLRDKIRAESRVLEAVEGICGLDEVGVDS
jgi:hypothetical protein